MISVRVHFPRGEQRKIERLLAPKRINRAEVEALNRTRNNVHKFGYKRLAKVMGTTASRLKKRGRSWRDEGGNKVGNVIKGRNASHYRLHTSIIGIGRPFNLTRYKARPIKRGNRTVAVLHRAWGETQIAEGMWILNRPGEPVVIRSKSRGYVRGGFGPGVETEMSRPDMLKALRRFTQRRFRHHWRSRVAYHYKR